MAVIFLNFKSNFENKTKIPTKTGYKIIWLDIRSQNER